ncbi:hypothetical protein, partial [Gemmatimonas sp.]|uniref:hypothetical protein n=1 Tax=Gemmatimonas sp. TaxID=1962908 RepID=UPI00391F58AF
GIASKTPTGVKVEAYLVLARDNALVQLFMIRRRRDRRKLEAMRAADALQEAAARESALQAILDGGVSEAESRVTP